MLIIPLQAVPSQTISVALNGQSCQIDIYQKNTGVYCNLYVNNSLIIGGVICENLNWIVRSDYLGFLGDLFFEDILGDDDPDYTGFGSRFIFCYAEPVDIGQ